MPLWGGTDNAANSVTWAPGLLNVSANTANKTALFGNTTMGAFQSGKTVSQEGLTAAEISGASGAHSGWNLKTTGTGSLISITISAGGTGYSNTNLVAIAASGTGSVNAAATLVTNATGGIITVAITNPGAGFVSVNPTVTVTNSTGGATGIGTSANLIAIAGGRAGRVSYETLVATGSLA